MKFFHKNFYLDDGLMSVESESEAVQLVSASRKLCQDSRLRLHEFITNSRKVLETVPIDCADAVKELDLARDPLPMECPLGVRWCMESNVFQFRISVDKDKLAKRGLLSTVLYIFSLNDPTSHNH